MAQHEHVDQAIAAVAMRQHRQINRKQLLAVGLTSPAITYRVRSGRLYRVFNGVYSVGTPARTPIERAAAALLACGPTAAVSHASAMVLWGLWKRWPATVEVSVTTRRGPRGVHVHHPTTLALRDLRTHQGIRTTTVARTLLDMATRLEPKSLTRAVNNALTSPYLTEVQLAELLDRNATHPGTPKLRPFVADAASGRTRSELEDAFIAFCSKYGFPRPKTNFPVNGYLVDAYFEAERLIVELDSWSFHHTRTAFESDRTRDVDALTRGIATVRITHERMTTDSDGEAERLRTILEQRR